MLINLKRQMQELEKAFNRLCDAGGKANVDRAFKLADRWNKIRQIIEYQESLTLKNVA